MAFSEEDRVQIRLYVGASALFLQAWPALENAITTVQSIAEGGTRPDDSTETLVKGLVTKLQAVDTRLEELQTEMEAGKVDELGVDPARATAVVKMNGRILVGRLCRTLGLKGPLADVFSPQSINSAGFVGL